MLPPLTEELIDRAFAEDVGDGDHTTLSTIPASATGSAQLLVKDTGILAGVELALAILERYDPHCYLHEAIRYGDRRNGLSGAGYTENHTWTA